MATSNHRELAAILILPPGKSILLLLDGNGQSALLESHTHPGRGGIIAASRPGNLLEMTSYIDFMARRDWTCNPIPFVVT